MKKLNIKYISIAAVALISFSSCDDLFTPANENNLGVDYMLKDASYAEGVLGNAYTRIPCNSFPFSEVGTDDAVSNDATNDYRKIAAGTWTSDNNPTERWRDCRAGIMYINLFLSKADQVHWADDSIAAHMYCDREKGEAYGLRAMFMFYLLQAHGGMTADGQLLGIPIVTVPEDGSSNFNVPRNTFAECMKAIYDDCDKALALLPTKYTDHTSDADIPAKYKTAGATISEYNRVYGAKFNGRMDGTIVEAFRSKASLLAASPAYASGSGINYEKAADDAAVVLDRIGGIAGMDQAGWTWYTNTKEIDGLANGANPKEVMWRGEKSQNNDWESDNFPPSLYGKGHINPTQNFVDAFPMGNGYPINDPRSDYNANNPYTNRDPRLAAYVVYDGTAVGVNDTKINTESTSTTKDGINKVAGTSTRTGYYLRKLLRQDINLDPANTSKQYHYTPRIRFTEIFLNYAEAANEVWGPTGKGSHNYSAFDIIKAIRERAGICKNTDDPYLDECAQNKDKMRELIRNERRIELSFEGFRFWDLRRWKAPLDETAKGIDIATDAQGNVTYKDIDVDTRNYKDYMIYGPVPYSEILKFNELKQNQGW
jgi:hypothetical protein